MRFDYSTIDQKYVYVDGLYFIDQNLDSVYIAFFDPKLIKIVGKYLDSGSKIDILLFENIQEHDILVNWQTHYWNFVNAKEYFIYSMDIVKKKLKIKN